eukprot:scaffold171365_cov24-Prasinocladus_malaysianus.AAC.1
MSFYWSVYNVWPPLREHFLHPCIQERENPRFNLAEKNEYSQCRFNGQRKYIIFTSSSSRWRMLQRKGIAESSGVAMLCLERHVLTLLGWPVSTKSH